MAGIAGDIFLEKPLVDFAVRALVRDIDQALAAALQPIRLTHHGRGPLAGKIFQQAPAAFLVPGGRWNGETPAAHPAHRGPARGRGFAGSGGAATP